MARPAVIMSTVVAITLVAAVAGFFYWNNKQLRALKISEANEMLDLIKKGAASYYTTPRTSRDTGERVGCQFPATVAVTPAGGTCCSAALDKNHDGRCDSAPTNWDNPTWAALRFAITDEHYFQYQFESSGTLGDAIFTVTATADLNCDGKLTTIKLVGKGSPTATAQDCGEDIGQVTITRQNAGD